MKGGLLQMIKQDSLPWNSIWLEELYVAVETHCWLLRIQLESWPAVETRKVLKTVQLNVYLLRKTR